MRRTPIILLAVAVLAAGCSGGEEAEATDAPTDAPSTVGTTVAPTPRTTATAPPVREPGPAEIAEQALLAFAAGDHETWRALLDPAAPMFDPVDWVDDFDGDGVSAMADYAQFSIALGAAIERTITVHGCEPVSEIEADCGWTRTSAFYDLAGLPGVDESFRYVVENSRVVSWVIIDPPEGEEDDPHREAMLAYEQWVQDNHAEEYPEVFRSPCCDLDMIRLPEAIPIHEEFMPEYFELMREE